MTIKLLLRLLQAAKRKAIYTQKSIDRSVRQRHRAAIYYINRNTFSRLSIVSNPCLTDDNKYNDFVKKPSLHTMDGALIKRITT